ncbi:hypothetical protein GCM10008960_42280 [Deinococcus sedimenti]|uniref:Uncharacterized protein n=2 Tax=Deinococcus sedimenti TaxID=1867090 RepID=A0ABQ2SAG1_9DEIO|nr:hypothetical protein GCM10008960_42280 [Deinococcus sedimenti]
MTRQEFQAEERLISVLSRFADHISDVESGDDSDVTASFPDVGTVGFQLHFVTDGTPAAIRRWFTRQSAQPTTAAHLVLAAPYLSERAMDECEAAGASALDLAGNYRLNFGPYHLERVGHAPPPAAKREQANLYAGKTLQVVRALLAAPHRPWPVQDLARTCQVSLGTVSTVRQKLLTQGWLETTAGGVVVPDPEGLLRDWAEWTRATPAPTLSAYTVHSSKQVIERLTGQTQVLLGAASAAEWMAPFVTPKGTVLYTTPEAWRRAAKRLDAEEVDKGGNLTVHFVEDGVFVDRLEIKIGLWTASPAQTFVDLWRQGSRGREGAEKLLQNYLRPLWDGQKLYASWPLIEEAP